VAGIQAAISAQGGTLADVLNDYAVREMTGGWGIDPLDSATVSVTGAPIVTGSSTGPIGARTVSVNHLAARILELTRGDGHPENACFAATLTITVALPAGVGSRPYFYWTGDADPTPAPIADPVTVVPTADVAPAITVLAPLLLHVDAVKRTLRLIVEASGQGKVRATLGGVDLGSPAVRPGNNDLRFAIPKSLLTRLRRAAAAGNVLTLTPVSTSGAATGRAVTRQVALPPVKKKK
jgi:hypothetical protein